MLTETELCANDYIYSLENSIFPLAQ
uniref:Uncharacterized protein n=1 Tax=Arundo donax TaxID=35708 RepID=A0A0A9GDV0_ARUDO